MCYYHRSSNLHNMSFQHICFSEPTIMFLLYLKTRKESLAHLPVQHLNRVYIKSGLGTQVFFTRFYIVMFYKTWNLKDEKVLIRPIFLVARLPWMQRRRTDRFVSQELGLLLLKPSIFARCSFSRFVRKPRSCILCYSMVSFLEFAQSKLHTRGRRVGGTPSVSIPFIIIIKMLPLPPQGADSVIGLCS